MSRPGWDDTWAEVARTIALRSRCSRAQVGAVIVDANNRIIATGYNGPPANYEPATHVRSGQCAAFCERARRGPAAETLTSYTDCPSVHAELNALMFVDRSRCEGGAIYIMGPPCWTCAKAIANSGLTRVVIIDDGEDRSYRDEEHSYGLLLDSGVIVEGM